MAASGKERLRSHRRAGAMIALAAFVLAVLIALATSGSSAHAAGYGQIDEAWGTIGTGKGQLEEPTVYGVDPADGSVYVGDTRQGEPVSYRLQKFSSAGAFEASAELPGFLNVPEKKERLSYRGVAVDHANGFVYVLEQCLVGTAVTPTCKATGSGTAFAFALRVFKTTPTGEGLVPAPTPRILLPTSEADQIRRPVSIAVDPVSHGVVILGSSFQEHSIIERVGPTGVVEARFEDSESKLQKFGSLIGPGGAVVGPTGTVYTLVGTRNSVGAEKTRLWELPQDLASVAQVPGFAAAAEAENWAAGGFAEPAFAPALALSPDGKSIYWMEGDKDEVRVRDFSLATNSTVAVFGGGSARCQIHSLNAAVGAWGEGAIERLLVLDPGTVEKPRNQVITFGQGGTGCPTPVAKFKVNGTEADGTVVQADAPVEFNAGSSELLGGEAKQVTWNFGDGSEATVVKCPELLPGTGCEGPASLKTTHEFETNGEFTVTVEIELTAPTFGTPAPVSHTLIVEGGAPPPPGEIVVEKKGTGTGTVKSSPAGIDCGSSCSAAFEAGQSVIFTATPASDSKFIGWSGNCLGTGTCTLTSGGMQSVTADFEAKVAPSEFELSVSTGGPGTVTSAPTGIDCGSQCARKFASGAKVTLTASPTGTAKFAGWSGACAGVATSCEVEMTETRSVRATFAIPEVGQVLLVSVAGDGAGAVKSARPGINCGVHCEGSYKRGTLVALFPEAMPGSEFVSWGGACVGVGLVCELKMTSGRSVSAVFVRKQTVTVTSPPLAAPAAAPAAPSPTPATKAKAKKKRSSESGQKAVKQKLAKCRKLKPAAKAKCVRKAHQKPHGKRHS